MARTERIDKQIAEFTEAARVARFRLRLARQAVDATHPGIDRPIGPSETRVTIDPEYPNIDRIRDLAAQELQAARESVALIDNQIAQLRMSKKIYPNLAVGSVMLVVSEDGATAECWERINPTDVAREKLGGLALDQPDGWWIRPSDPDGTPEPYNQIIHREYRSVDDFPVTELDTERLFTMGEVEQIVDLAIAYDRNS
jgi:hypothetical protein